jgi:hypothetical protein
VTSSAGRELQYLHWPHEELAKAMVQAENDIKELKRELEGLREERGRYYEESRESSRILGGIIRLLRDEGVEMHDNPAHGDSGRPVRPYRFHRHAGSNSISDFCACGAQWLMAADRCVTQV